MDEFSQNKPKDGILVSAGKSLLNAAGLGSDTPIGKQISKLTGWDTSQNRLGAGIGKDGKKPLPNFDVKFTGQKDFRAKIEVPSNYLKHPTVSSYTNKFNNGILFPYTPTISQDYSASYNTLNPTHSNYSLYFYKNSTPGAISISGKFTVENPEDALLWLNSVHILRAVTKMRFGGDSNAGAPPPVCRFSAYGDMQYRNVPVVIQSFRVELPDAVDYYVLDPEGRDAPGNAVPVSSNITVNLLPMYSRQELLGQKQVDDYVGGNLRQRGFL